jgi:hypothetical protein
MKLFFACCILCIVASRNVCSAQILNIDKSDTANYEKKGKTNFNLASGLEIDKQKTTLYDATTTAEFSLQKNHELFIASASDRFTYNGPDDILNTGFIHLRLRHNYKNKYQPEIFTQYQWDNKRGLEHRILNGANMRYNFWKGGVWELNAAVGLMYENERWNYNGVDSTKIPANAPNIVNNLIKINSYIHVEWHPNANNTLTVKVYLQSRPDFWHPRIAPLLNWSIKIGKHTAFVIGFNGMYDANPVVPIDNFYYNITNSILISW